MIIPVVRGDPRVITLLCKTGQRALISSAIKGRAGDDEGDLCATGWSSTSDRSNRGRGNGDRLWDDESDSRSQGGDHSSGRDSLLGAATVARGESSATELSAENELKVATLGTIDRSKGERPGLGAAGALSNSS